MQKSKIADSVSLLTGCTAIFDFYTAKAVHEQAAKTTLLNEFCKRKMLFVNLAQVSVGLLAKE